MSACVRACVCVCSPKFVGFFSGFAAAVVFAVVVIVVGLLPIVIAFVPLDGVQPTLTARDLSFHWLS